MEALVFKELQIRCKEKTRSITTYENLRLQISSPPQSVDLGNFQVIPAEVHCREVLLASSLHFHRPKIKWVLRVLRWKSSSRWTSVSPVKSLGKVKATAQER